MNDTTIKIGNNEYDLADYLPPTMGQMKNNKISFQNMNDSLMGDPQKACQFLLSILKEDNENLKISDVMDMKANEMLKALKAIAESISSNTEVLPDNPT